MSMRDPGLDMHDWEARYQQLEPELRDEPERALPELADLVQTVLEATGFAVEDSVADDGISPEYLAGYRSAREISDAVERGETVDPAEIGQAIENLRDVYQDITTNRPS